MKWIRKHKKKLLFGMLGIVLLGATGLYVVGRRFLNGFFRETPNTLSFEGDLHSVPFQWSSSKSDGYDEPHGAMLIPVKVPGLPNQLYMQFDTGSPYTFLRSGCLDSLKDRGVDFEIFEQDERPRLRKFELDIGGNRVVLNPGRIMTRDISIDWEKPINVIGTLGADFIDQKICEIDFPGLQIGLYKERPETMSSQGSFTAFEFKGRRIMLPAVIDGVELQLFYDSGCSPFGLLTSKYHFDKHADKNGEAISFDANRFGEPVPIHHQSCDVVAKFGDVDLPINRVSYVDMYSGLQSAFGRFIDGGFMGNKSLIDSTLILDTKANEFLLVRQ